MDRFVVRVIIFGFSDGMSTAFFCRVVCSREQFHEGVHLAAAEDLEISRGFLDDPEDADVYPGISSDPDGPSGDPWMRLLINSDLPEWGAATMLDISQPLTQEKA